MKYLSKMMLALFFAISLFLIPGTNQALYFPPTLYDNDQIVLVYGHMGHGTYVDKTSVVVEYYNPPYYKLAANVLTYNAEKGYLAGTRTQHYSYNIETGAIYVGDYGPLYDRSTNPMAKQRPVDVAKTIWEAAYHMPWRW
ncbi:hypothetical protein [uncultured Megasphaera sp.]|uniref:hypothetical protein n=1 Tax=uncultured Megasphaera sp. TaxID=165188 RepID=UPI0025E36749|nr:hypothetical protein [uncultured Megasphaera sp.]